MSDFRRLIHEIGRGPRGARDLPLDDARSLWSAVIDGRLSPVALGAALMAMRLKGESLDELRALREVVHERLEGLANAGAPLVCMPCYNGARRVPNLSWLTALALRAGGFAVLMHGVRRDAGRLATCEVVEAAGGAVADSVASARRLLARDSLVFLPIDVWCPPLAQLLAVREQTGVRNTGHTIAKLLRPTRDALLLVPITHAHYLSSTTAILSGEPGSALVFRGVDGEPALYPHSARSLYRIAEVLESEAAPSPASSRDAPGFEAAPRPAKSCGALESRAAPGSAPSRGAPESRATSRPPSSGQASDAESASWPAPLGEGRHSGTSGAVLVSPGAAARVVEITIRPEAMPDPAVSLPPTASAGEVANWSAEVVHGRRPMPSTIASLVEQARIAVAVRRGTT